MNDATRGANSDESDGGGRRRGSTSSSESRSLHDRSGSSLESRSRTGGATGVGEFVKIPVNMDGGQLSILMQRAGTVSELLEKIRSKRDIADMGSDFVASIQLWEASAAESQMRLLCFPRSDCVRCLFCLYMSL